ncbi:B3 domain-containing protein At2g31420-like [Cucurbita pepo subsp. pepo]|uniref:B3 domain-containing protein At2g31420-like n=1 Tax=Cucurbita pepo subsp. pepo TaxID=3664 RepID=UPI000C9D4EB9|nr:B3 domain-containing protein At2g31420-like [Cucurbita pepo subsp. pepo]
MGMSTRVESLGMEITIPDLSQIYIPKRIRGSSGGGRKEQIKAETDPCVLEAASTLMDFAKTVPIVETEKGRNTRKRKTPTSNAPTTRRKMVKKTEYPSIPEMSDGMRERIVEMGGREIHLVIQKQVQHTNISKNHGRLSLPINKLRFDFTTEEERRLLNEHENKNKKGMDVLIIDDVGREKSICLKKWKIGSSDTYCLMTQWNALVEETALKAGEHIQLWSFRKEEAQLGLALVKLGSC